jgi:HTH-type transcriptional regulator/antitoxin MqsA
MSRKQTCPVCAGDDFAIERETLTFKPAEGEAFQYVAEYSRCVRCGEEFYTRQQSRAATLIAVSEMRRRQRRLAPAEILGIREQYDVTQAQAEAILGFGKKSFLRWEAGLVCQSRAADQLLREVRSSPALFERLAAQAGVKLPEKAAVWVEFLDTVFADSYVLPAFSLGGTPEARAAPEANEASDFRAVRLGLTPHAAANAIGARMDQTNGPSSPEFLGTSV